MKPHIYLRTSLYGNFKEWTCVERHAISQRGHFGYMVTYSAAGATPFEAYQRCMQVKADRAKGASK